MARDKCGLSSICGQGPTKLLPALGELRMAITGTLKLEKIIEKVGLKSKGFQIQQTEWVIRFKPLKSSKFQNSYIERFIAKGQ